ncbi:MAG: LysM peptidoglycan-binding domain-containing M23 family metallopeptidase [Acidobacteriota bacterium]|nr:LysM peptidoglycan-binding domain-containing M23 family metallopeptidase [Acidobacteriota bacterium]MDH3784742.1 LysM peptidoglycan-binding domain-containing M23 family metallopeptidase [Acidobacteriota bacterium]
MNCRCKKLGFAVALLIGATAGCAGRQAAFQPSTVGETLPDRAGLYHDVLAGQTLWRIATAYGLTVDALIAVNHIDTEIPLEIGQPLWIPGAHTLRVIPDYPADPRGSSTGERRVVESIDGNEWAWPVPGGRLISEFGAPRGGRRHMGIDVQAGYGAKIVASLDGRVTYSGSGMRGYGKTVMLDHGHGLQTLYAHNSELLVRVGQRVTRGTPIARLGQSGNATGPHCHFELRRNDAPIDPLLLRIAGGPGR